MEPVVPSTPSTTTMSHHDPITPHFLTSTLHVTDSPFSSSMASSEDSPCQACHAGTAPPPTRSTELSQQRRQAPLNFLSLIPVRTLLHSLLSDDDAARLLRVSRTVATLLLRSYTFTQHVFEPMNMEEIRRLRALYETYDMRPTRMCVHAQMEVTLEAGNGRSPFPSSVTSLLTGPVPWSALATKGSIHPQCIFGSEAAKADSIQCLWTNPLSESVDAHYQQLLMQKWAPPVFGFVETRALANCSLPPGSLPPGLRRLHLSLSSDTPLQAGFIPSTVEVLSWFSNSLSASTLRHLPSSLVHLVLTQFNQPLTPHLLPSTLQRLSMYKYDHPLMVDGVSVLPSSLRAVSLAWFNQSIQPHALPSGVTHLQLSDFDQPLYVNSLPPALVSLHLGGRYSHPLQQGVFPSSLRVLFFQHRSAHPLRPGVLPEGLEVLHWNYSGFHSLHRPLLDIHRPGMELRAGVLPSALRVLDLGRGWAGDIAAGAIPAGVRWLLAPNGYRERVGELQLSAVTQVVWESSEE